MFNDGSCNNPNRATDTGIAQILASTAGDYFCDGTIKPEHHPALAGIKCAGKDGVERSPETYTRRTKDAMKRSAAARTGRRIIDILPRYPELQLEFLAVTIKRKMGSRCNNPSISRIQRYNYALPSSPAAVQALLDAGTILPHNASYGRRVYNRCYRHLRGKTLGDIDAIVSRMNQFSGVGNQLDAIRKTCEGKKRDVDRLRKDNPIAS